MIEASLLGCNELDRKVYALHNLGVDCKEIGRRLGIPRAEARQRIIKIWNLDRERAQCNARLRASSTM